LKTIGPVAARRAKLAADSAAQAIDALQRDPRLARVTDFRTIGAIGYSFGAATAAQLSRDDSRIRGVVNFDGSLYGDAETIGVDVPYLVFFSDWAYPTPEELNADSIAVRSNAVLCKEAFEHQLRQSALPNNWTFQVLNTEHADFADELAVPPLSALRGERLDRAKVWSALNQLISAFFRKSLLGTDEPSLAKVEFEGIRPFLERMAPPPQR